MTIFEAKYLSLLNKILEEGETKENRTGINTKSIIGHMFEHDMTEGFPVLIGKKLPWTPMIVEVEGFLKGKTDKAWYQERGCNIWNSWHRPDRGDKNDLGPIYGYQLRRFGQDYDGFNGKYVDQLEWLCNEIKTNPTSRRLVVSYWNPLDLKKQALPPCHNQWQIIISGNKMSLLFNMRSVDVPLGFPFDFAHYAVILSLLASQFNYTPHKLIAQLADCHIYENQIEKIHELFDRYSTNSNIDFETLPTLKISEDFKDITQFKFEQANLENYNPLPILKMEVAI